MGTGNVVIVVSKHSPKKYAGIVLSLFSDYDRVLLVARGRHVSRLSDVLRQLKGRVRIVQSEITYADYAPEFTVLLAPVGGDGGG